jgi:hypothetical protein
MYGLSLSDAAFFDDTPSLRIDQYPVIRRFYQRTPPRHTKYVTQLYDALAEATAARRTMRHMDRTFRPDFAKEIEDTPENLEYGQLTRAQKGMRGISAEMRFVVNAPDLPTLQRHAVDLARETRTARPVDRGAEHAGEGGHAGYRGPAEAAEEGAMSRGSQIMGDEWVSPKAVNQALEGLMALLGTFHQGSRANEEADALQERREPVP